jgi:hypothetical protein
VQEIASIHRGSEEARPIPEKADRVIRFEARSYTMMSLSKWVGAAAFVLLGGAAVIAADAKAPPDKSAPTAPSLYFAEKVDPNDDGQLWTMQKEGDDFMLISKSAKAALDVNDEKGKLYLNDKVDGKNPNQLWTIKTQGDYSMIVPNKGKGLLDKGALDANDVKDQPYINPKTDAANNNMLWTLEKHGDFFMILPKGHKVALGVHLGTTATVAGIVASAGDGKITVTADGKDQVLAVSKDADISSDGKACKLEDLKKGASVAVTMTKVGDSTLATKVDAKNKP